MLAVCLLGQFDVQLDERRVDIPSRSAQRLLAYLLLNAGTPQRREKLSGLFWPEAAESNARSNLRHGIWRLRKALQPNGSATNYLLADSFTVAWNPAAEYWLDTAMIERGGLAGSLDEQAQALAVYRGELLPGFYDDWVSLERERLEAVFARRMQELLDGLAAAGRWPDVLTWAERWLAQGQALEPAYRALIQAHGAAGDIGAAAATYQRCREALSRDLGVEPSEQTRRLYEQVRQAAKPLPQAPGLRAVPVDPPVASRLPTLNTPFVGRESELREVGERLRDPDCRLLTLTGPGGIGKTRLGIQAAAQAMGFQDGAQFVRLSAVSSSGGLVSAMAEALHFSFYGGDDPIVQLVEYLRPKSLLLLLDNFEHLLDGAELVATILRSAPGVKFLVTSQERLNLQGEWLLEVDGMSLPEAESLSTDDAARYGAVQLFVACARRVDAGFRLRPEDVPGVLRICRLVGGTPLGIELAAAWLRAISIGEIAQEIQRSLQFLSTSQRDMPERHRSLQAVFDHSWNRLPEAERRVFCRLSVFSGGFARDAAEAVAGATLADLSALMDKSLLRRLGTGRYAMHGLLRDFAQAKLGETGELPVVRGRQLEFFLGMAGQAEAGLRGLDQLEWLRRLDLEHDNLRRALQWALEAGRAAGQRLAGDLARFWYLRGNWREGREWLTTMLATAPAGDNRADADDCARLARAKALMGLGWLADEDGSEEPLYRQSLELCRAAGDEWGAAYSLRGIGSKLCNDGSLDQSAALLTESLAIFGRLHDEWGIGLVHHNLGWVAFGQDDYARAQATWTTGLEYFRRSGDRWGIAVTLGALTYLARQRDEYPLAASLSEESLALFRELGDRAGIAVSLLRLAQIAFRRSNYSLAITLIEESQTLHEDMGDKRGLVNAKSLLGVVHCYQGRYQQAATLLEESWNIGAEVWGENNYPFLLNYMDLVPYMQGRLEEAAERWGQAAIIQREQEDPLGTAFSLWGLGAVALAQGDLDRAFERLEYSLALFRRVNDRRFIGIVLNALARAEFARGRPERARELVAESLMQRRYSGDRQGMAEGFETLAALLVAAIPAALERAAELFGLAEALREAVGAPLPPVELADYQEAVSALRKEFDAKLGGRNAGEAFAAAWQSGRAMATVPLETLLELVPVAGASAPRA